MSSRLSNKNCGSTCACIAASLDSNTRRVSTTRSRLAAASAALCRLRRRRTSINEKIRPPKTKMPSVSRMLTKKIEAPQCSDLHFSAYFSSGLSNPITLYNTNGVSQAQNSATTTNEAARRLLRGQPSAAGDRSATTQHSRATKVSRNGHKPNISSARASGIASVPTSASNDVIVKMNAMPAPTETVVVNSRLAIDDHAPQIDAPASAPLRNQGRSGDCSAVVAPAWLSVTAEFMPPAVQIAKAHALARPCLAVDWRAD